MSDIRKTGLLGGLMWLKKDGPNHYWSIAKDGGWEKIPKRLFVMLLAHASEAQDD